MIEFSKKNIRKWSMLGMRRTVGAVLPDLAEMDDKFLMSFADSGRYFLYETFKRKYPDRVVEFGISEQNMVVASAGLVNEGFHVFAGAYATFITARVLDQVRVNMGKMQIPLKLIGGAGGLGEANFSPTHMGLEDVANMRCIPGMTVIAPADCTELVKAMVALMDYDKPAYIRQTGRNNLPVIYKEDYEFVIGKAITLKEGTDIAIVSNGVVLQNVLDAAKKLEEDGISCKVINMHTVKPLDTDILDSIANMKLVVSVEEHSVYGGLGSAIAEYYAQSDNRPKQLFIGVEGDQYPKSGIYEDVMDICGFSAEKIYSRISATNIS